MNVERNHKDKSGKQYQNCQYIADLINFRYKAQQAADSTGSTARRSNAVAKVKLIRYKHNPPKIFNTGRNFCKKVIRCQRKEISENLIPNITPRLCSDIVWPHTGKTGFSGLSSFPNRRESGLKTIKYSISIAYEKTTGFPPAREWR
ncbi:hypothetical protein [Neisseria sp.]|uniref:hypothetical protein n=1 Tax=Neisseria sp. TaxID=192066 RepID=UPI0035A19CA5